MSEEVLARLIEKVEGRYYGKYRALVVDNADPEKRGRLRLRIPSVLGDEIVSGWALPCAPYGGAGDQGFFFIPENEAGVWVEFEAGDLEYPVWVGTFWSKPGGASEVPKPNQADGSEESEAQHPPTCKIIKTRKGHTIQLEDKDGEERILIIDGEHKHRIVIDSEGITLAEKSGNQIVIESGGIAVKGFDPASQHFVLGESFNQKLQNFIVDLNTHTHTGNLGAPTSPPTKPMQLDVKLSQK